MTIDQWLAFSGLAVLFALEGLIPFYDQAAGRWSHAARNLGLAIFSGSVGALMAPLILCSIELARAREWGLLHVVEMPIVLGVLLGLVLFDFWMYLWHRANHEIPLLWRLHRVHHTDPRMDSTTAFRFHPGEILISTLLNSVVILILGLDLTTLIFYKSLMVLVILLHHSNVRLPGAWERGLRVLIVPPSMHRVHHSQIRTETDSNYGTIFSYWDRLFGTFRLCKDHGRIRFGIGRFESLEWQSPMRLLLLPFREEGQARAQGRPASLRL